MASFARSALAPSRTASVPLFLAPAFAKPLPTARRTTAATQFSTTPSHSRSSSIRKQEGIRAETTGKPNWALQARPKIDRNKKRGVSAIRRTGPRSTRGLWKYPLPVPVARDHRGTSPDYVDSAEHGLWGFFDKRRQAMLEPEQESSHGMNSIPSLPAMGTAYCVGEHG